MEANEEPLKDGIKEFRGRALALGAKYLPGHVVMVETFDFENFIGVACQTPHGLRHAVKGRAHDRMLYPPWWKFWKKPILARAISPNAAIAALAKWAIEKDV